MNSFRSISNVCHQLGLTSRTLRHWEDRGLINSHRDPQSGWRFYDQETIGRIRLVMLFRQLDIPLDQVKLILDEGNILTVTRVLSNHIRCLSGEIEKLVRLQANIEGCLSAISKTTALPDRSPFIDNVTQTIAVQLTSDNNLKGRWKETMSSIPTKSSLRIIKLPAMRTAVCNVLSASPEDKAIQCVLEWARSEGLMGTVRLFGMNTTAYDPSCKEYGWAACITVPEDVEIPGFLREMRLPGGLYASLDSTNEVYDSWQILTDLLQDSEYTADKTRPCLEEHIIAGDCDEGADRFYLTLLEPVCRR